MKLSTFAPAIGGGGFVIAAIGIITLIDSTIGFTFSHGLAAVAGLFAATGSIIIGEEYDLQL